MYGVGVATALASDRLDDRRQADRSHRLRPVLQSAQWAAAQLFDSSVPQPLSLPRLVREQPGSVNVVEGQPDGGSEFRRCPQHGLAACHDRRRRQPAQRLRVGGEIAADREYAAELVEDRSHSLDMVRRCDHEHHIGQVPQSHGDVPS